MPIGADISGLNEPTTPNREQERAAARDHRRVARNPRFRQRWLSRLAKNPSVVRSSLASADVLMDFSDDKGKPVFPSQRRLAQLTHVDRKTIYRHIKQFEAMGAIKVYRSRPIRDTATGRFIARKTNRYYFCMPAELGDGSRVRRKPCSRLRGTDGPITVGFETSSPKGREEGDDLDCSGVASSPPTRHRKLKDPTQDRSFGDSRGCESCDHTGWTLTDADEAVACACTRA